MKSKVLTTLMLLLMLFSVSVVLGQVAIWQDNFNDNDISDWTRTQPSTCVVSGGQLNFSRTGGVGTASQYLTSATINTTTAESFVYDVISVNYGDVLDRFRFEFSADGSTAWTEVTPSNLTAGTNQSITIPTAFKTTSFKLRVRYRLHGPTSAEVLDNFKIVRAGMSISPMIATPVVGDQIQFTATGGTGGYVWTHSTPLIGTITQTGLFTATAAGTTRVRVTSGTEYAETDNITIDYMRIVPNTASLWVGDTMQFTAQGGVGTKRFYSANPAIATITQQGFLTAVAVGSTTISVRDQNNVVVNSGPITVSQISEFEPVQTLIENTPYPHGPTRLWNSRNITMTATGIIYSAYERGLVSSGREVVVKKSLDGGSTWTEILVASTLMTSPRKLYQPAIAVDGTGNIHLTWYGDQTTTPQQYKIWYTMYNGTSWSTATEISSGSSYVFPSIACDNSGNVLIAYTKQSGSTFVGPYYNKKWGGSWVGQVEISTSSVQNGASCTIDRNNGLGVIAWPSGFSNPTSANTGKVSYINPNGTQNGTPTSVLTGLNYDMLQAAFNSQSDLFLFYNLTSPDGGDVTHFRWKANSDGTWRRPLTFDGSLLETCFGSGAGAYPLGSFCPQFAFDEYDNIYLFAEGKPTADDEWNIYMNICLADDNPNLDARYGISDWQSLSNAQKLFWDASDDCAFVSLPEKLYNGFNIIPVVWSDGNLVNDGNTGHFPQGEHPGGTTADIRYKSIVLEYEPPATGGVSGYVTVTGTTTTLSGSLVSIVGTAFSTYSDAGGYYELLSVPVGPQTIRVTADGYYQTEQLTTIMEGQTITVNLSVEAVPLPAPESLQAEVQNSSVSLTWQAPNSQGETVLLREGFEGTIAGWGSWDVDNDGNQWGVVTSSAAALTGDKLAASNSYLNNQNLTPNNWLYSPMITLGYGSTLTFWVGANNPQYYAEKYYVKMSLTDNTTHANYTVTLTSETLPSANWREKVVDLSSWGGRTVSFAWQHTECTGQSQLFLDDVLVTDDGSPNPNPENELIYDSGLATTYYQLNGGTMASRMSPTGPCQILRLKMNTRTSPTVNAFNAEVWDWAYNEGTGNWQPGSLLAQIPSTGVHNAWTEVDVSGLNLNVTGDFLVGFGSINTSVGMGYSATNNNRAWDYMSGAWSVWSETYHLRAVVQYAGGRIVEIDSDGGSRELTGYKIYRNGTDINLVGTQTLTYTDTNVPDGSYIYGVSALYTEGSGESSIVTIQVQVGNAAPASPANIQISNNDQYFYLTWDSVPGAPYYKVEASSDPMTGFTTFQDNMAATTLQIPIGLLTENKMFFRIIAKNTRGSSSLSTNNLLPITHKK